MDSKIADRTKYLELYKSRLPFMDELGLEHTLDFDAGGMRLRSESGRELLVTFEEMTRDIDGAIVAFSKGGSLPDNYVLDITITRQNEIVYRVNTRVKGFTTDINMRQRMSRNELTWVEDDEE